MELIRPAVDGTLAAMEGARLAKAKRLVLTSSVAAIAFPADRAGRESFSVKDWTVEENAPDAYYKSKMLAEKAAWDFLEKLPENERFELATVCPAFVMGPTLVKGTFASADYINYLLAGVDPSPAEFIPFVDVRNVAAAHLAGILKPEAAGKRFMLAEGPYFGAELAKSLKEVAGGQFPKLVEGEVPANAWTPKFIHDETESILGVEFIKPTQSVKDMLPTLIANGQVKVPA